MGSNSAQGQSVRSRRAGRPIAFAYVALAACPAISLSCGGDRSAEGFESAMAIGERASESALEAIGAKNEILQRVTFEPINYDVVSGLESMPSVKRTCGVAYRLSPERWGIVAGVTHTCDDNAAREEALRSARTRLRSHLDLAVSDHEERLQALRAPGRALAAEGLALTQANTLGVDFDLQSCVETVSDKLQAMASAVSAVQCDAFLSPAAMVEDFREQLGRAAERALGLRTAAVEAPAPISAEGAARCNAQPGSSALAVPGAVSATLGSNRAAYLVRLAAGQSIVVTLSSGAFDAMLRLYDSSCGSELVSDDDGGGDTNSRLEFRSPQGGDYAIVVSAFEDGSRGPYRLAVSASGVEQALTDEQRQSLQAFADWVKRASEEDVITAWRGRAGTDLQLGCLNAERYRSAAIGRAGAFGEAIAMCAKGLSEATEATKLRLASQK